MTSFDLMVDPESIGTPQHKKHSLVRGRLLTYPDPKVSRARHVMTLLAKNAIGRKNLSFPDHGKPVRLVITMFYAIPKSRRKESESCRNQSRYPKESENRHPKECQSHRTGCRGR